MNYQLLTRVNARRPVEASWWLLRHSSLSHYILEMDPEIAKKLTEMRRLERHAKQLLYKMDRIEAEWNEVKKELIAKGREVSHQLGDILHGFRKK